MVARRAAVFLLVPLASVVMTCTTPDSPTQSAVTPTRLTFVAQPSNVAAGAAISPSITVAVEDSSGRIDSTASENITLSLGQNPGGGALSGILTAPAVGGLATFSIVSVSAAGAGYTLVASTPALLGATSGTFAVSPGIRGSVAFVVQPSGGSAGGVLSPPIQVAILDTTGTVVSTAANVVTVAIGANPSNAVLSGTASVIAVNGVAMFSTLTLNRAGAGYTLNAYSGALRGATSATFNVGPGTPAMLAFVAQPPSGNSRQVLTPAMEVAVEDAEGAVVTSAANTVTLTIGANPGPGTLSGNTAVAAVNGVATFGTLSVNNPGTGYTLQASAVGLTAATSSSFSIFPSTYQVVSAGGYHTCAIATGGKAYCWGDDTGGELGDGTGPDVQTCEDLGFCEITTPLAVAGGLTFKTVSAGSGSYSCGVTTGGQTYCWGYDLLSQGFCPTEDGDASCRTPTPVSTSAAATEISVGGSHVCAVTSTGAGYCWGSNGQGQLGNGTTTGSEAPVAVSGGLPFTGISAGDTHTCGVAAGGVAYCWGDNGAGELGNGTATSSTTPVAASSLAVFASVSAGSQSSCGLTTGGAIYCWGDNTYGELGNGTTANSTSPVLVSGTLVFATVSVGAQFACGVTTGNVAYCWGSNANGQLGDGGGAASSTPVAVSGGLTFTTVDHTCGITLSGAAYCWGGNGSGQLGNGTVTGSTTPVPVF
jgi:alpha-tubulin suppressor-like RCC1 family protein